MQIDHRDTSLASSSSASDLQDGGAGMEAEPDLAGGRPRAQLNCGSSDGRL